MGSSSEKPKLKMGDFAKEQQQARKERREKLKSMTQKQREEHFARDKFINRKATAYWKKTGKSPTAEQNKKWAKDYEKYKEKRIAKERADTERLFGKMSDTDYKKFRSSKGAKEMREFDKKVREAEEKASRVIGRGGTQTEAKKVYDKAIWGASKKSNQTKQGKSSKGKSSKSKNTNPKMGKSSGSFKIEGGQKRKFK